MKTISDIAIIGGGPIGLFGAFYSGIRKLQCAMIESLPQLGGQLITLYPEKYIYDIPGYPKILAQDFVNKLIEQGTQFQPSIHLNEKITQLQQLPSNNGKPLLELTSEKGYSFQTRSVIMAIGSGAFTPRKPKVSNIQTFENQNLYYTVQDPQSFAKQNVLIIGGGDSAMDWALALENIADQITLIHRSDRFRAHEKSVEQVFNSKKIQVLTFYEIKAFIGKSHIEKVVISNNKNNEEIVLPVSSIISSLGFVTNIGSIKTWPFQFNRNTIKVNQTMETDIPGIWGAGDIVSYLGKIKLIATGFSEIAIAVNMIKHYLDPNSKIFPGHSSSMTHSKIFKV